MAYTEITTIEAALAKKGLTMPMIEEMHKALPEEYRTEKVVSFALDLVEDVLNSDDPIDWSNTDKPKWRLWYWIEDASDEDGSPAVGLSLGGCGYDGAVAGVGPRRAFASEPIARHAWQYFKKYYELEFSRGKLK